VATITTPGGAVIRPTLIIGHRSERAAGTRVHDILGAQVPEFTFNSPGTRAGQVSLFFPSYRAAAGASAALGLPGVYSMRDPDEPEWNMTLAVTDNIEVERVGEDGLRVFAVTFGYREASVPTNAFTLYPAPTLYPSDNLYPRD
jgi:hypothetical protein